MYNAGDVYEDIGSFPYLRLLIKEEVKMSDGALLDSKKWEELNQKLSKLFQPYEGEIHIIDKIPVPDMEDDLINRMIARIERDNE